jgi:hypothetical protein
VSGCYLLLGVVVGDSAASGTWATIEICIRSFQVSPSRTTIHVQCVRDATDHLRLFDKIDGFRAEGIRASFRVPEEYLKQLEFSECLPQPYATEIVKERLLRPALLETTLTASRVFVS